MPTDFFFKRPSAVENLVKELRPIEGIVVLLDPIVDGINVTRRVITKSNGLNILTKNKRWP